MSSSTPEVTKENESEEECMSDGDSEQPLREDPTDEMDAAPIPYSYGLAASMGVSSRKVQVMKASFFTNPSSSIHPSNKYTSTLASQQHQPTGSVRKGLLLNASTPPLFKQPVMPQPKQNWLQSQQEESPFSLLSPSVPDLSSPTVMSTVAPQGLMPFALLPESVSDHYHTCVRNTELGLAFGRSFRTGWGLCWQFAHFGTALSSKPQHKKSSTGSLLRPLGLQKHLYTATRPRDVVPFNVNLEQLQSSVYLAPEGLKGKTLQVSFVLHACYVYAAIFNSSHP